MKQVQQIKLFVSCPDDIKDELSSINLIIQEINKTNGKQNNFVVECLNWKDDTYTQIGIDAQEVINNQIEGEYDVLVGLIWKKIGTPTRRDKSGTVEEINRAISNDKKELLVYFKTAPPENINLIDTDQLSKVNDFKKDLADRGVLYKEFNSIESFESLFRIHITNMIIERILPETKPSLLESKEKYTQITDLLNEVEKRDDSEVNLDIFELAEEIASYVNIVTASMTSFTINSLDLAANLKKRTDEINKAILLKDVKLRINKSAIILNLLAEELDEFNKRINQELPTFSKSIVSIGPTYSKLLLASANHDQDEIERLKKSVMEFRNTLQGTTEGCASLLKQTMLLPGATAKFNKSKRETEITLKDLLKEMLEGLIILDESIK